jgi:protein-disulfide isomerase
MAGSGRKRSKKNGGGRPAPVDADRKRFAIILAAIVVVGIAALLYATTRPPAATPVVADTTPPPPGSAKGYTLGRPDAPVHILEFADFECPACANYAVVTEPDVRKHIIDSGLANVTYYDFPLPMHKNTWVASRAAACANDQGKFWEMHDRLFAGQPEWNGEATDDPESVIEGYAKDLGLDVSTWRGCMKNRVHQREIAANKAEAERRHVAQTPTFIIGTQVIAGSSPYDAIRAAVDSAARAAHAATAAAPAHPS